MNSIKHPMIKWFFICLLFLFGCTTATPTPPGLTSQQKQALMEILDILTSTIEETEDMLVKDNEAPPGPYKDLIGRLQFMKDNIRKMKSDEVPFDGEIISNYTDEITNIHDIVKNSMEKVLNTDIFFDLGKYKISNLFLKAVIELT